MSIFILMTVMFAAGGGVAGGLKWKAAAVAWASFAITAAAGAYLALRHGVWPLILPVLGWLVVAYAWWAFVPRSTLPRNRVRRQNIRLRLRLHPGRGHATVVELHRHWGRLASARKARYALPTLTRAERVLRPGVHSVFLGRAQYRHAVRLPVEEHALVFAPPRTGKSSWLSSVILRYPGPVLNTTTRADIYKDTVRARAGLGRIDVFNPQRVGGLASTMRWDPIRGCEDPSVAIRRADAFASAVSSKGVEGGEFWADKCSSYLRALFFAAAYARTRGVMLGLPDTARWALTSTTREAEEILVDAGAPDWAAALGELRGAAEKTAATIRMYMSLSLGFLMDPVLAQAVTPDPDDPGLDLDSFARSQATLYMIATGQGEKSPLAPLFAALTSEIHYTAGIVGSCNPSGRLTRPMLFGLDEVTQICPVDLPGWLADSGGKNVQIIAVSHGLAQLRKRWGDDAAQIVLDTVGSQIVLPGIRDPKVLKDLSEASGDVSLREHGQHHNTQHPIMSPAMIRGLPDKHALVLRGNRAPVVAKVHQVWGDRLYRKLKNTVIPGTHATAERPVTVTDPVTAGQTPALEPAATVAAASQFSWTAGAR